MSEADCARIIANLTAAIARIDASWLAPLLAPVKAYLEGVLALATAWCG